MTPENVMQIIRSNGVGDNRCFFFSQRSRDSESSMSKINQYKYHSINHELKIVLDNSSLKEHEENLKLFTLCRVLINHDGPKGVDSIWIECTYIKIENKHIYVKINRIKYRDDGNDIMFRPK